MDILCKNDGKRYASSLAASWAYNLRKSDIDRNLWKRIKSVDGYNFKFVEPLKRRKIRHDLCKRVKCTQTGRIYASVQAAATAAKTSQPTMSSHLQGNRPREINGLTYVYTDAKVKPADLFGPL